MRRPGDTGGIELDDWYSINQQKYDILAPHLVPPVGAGTTMKTGWTLTWTYGGSQSIYNQWGAQLTQSGQSVTVRPVDYTTSIPAGQSITFGIQGTVTGSNAVPSPITCA